MVTLVTGSTGFVGASLTRQLLQQGKTVRILARKGSDLRNTHGLDVEICYGDLNEPTSLKQAVVGCEALYHVAADYRLWVPTPEVLYRTNVGGTRALMLAAAEAGVRRIVYTSSVATLSTHTHNQPVNEESRPSLKHMIGHYKRSKFLAEQTIHELVSQGLPIVTVNPSTPLGPGDVKPTPTGRMVLDAVRGKALAYVDTGLNIVHVNDVAQGHILAFERGIVGERYILGGENLSLKSIFTQIAHLTGGSPPKLRLPHNAVLPIAYASELWARLNHGPEPRVTVDGVRMSKHNMYFSSDKAVRELGYTYRPARVALADAVGWFKRFQANQLAAHYAWQ